MLYAKVVFLWILNPSLHVFFTPRSAAAISSVKENHPLQTANICSVLMTSIINGATAAALDRDTSLVAREIVDVVLQNVHIQVIVTIFHCVSLSESRFVR